MEIVRQAIAFVVNFIASYPPHVIGLSLASACVLSWLLMHFFGSEFERRSTAPFWKLADFAFLFIVGLFVWNRLLPT